MMPVFRVDIASGRKYVVLFQLEPDGEWRWGPEFDSKEEAASSLPLVRAELIERLFEHAEQCLVCGCTESSACLDGITPCHWIEPGLCSACASPFPREAL